MSDQTPPKRIEPYLPIVGPNEPIVIAKGPLRLAGEREGVVESDLVFRWTEAEFAGSCNAVVSPGEWFLVCEGDQPFRAPAAVTRVQPGSTGSYVRGVTRSFEIGTGSFDVLRFALANFPEYRGGWVSYGTDSWSGAFAGRIECRCDAGVLVVDSIPESSELAERDGFFLSHVGQWVPASDRMTSSQAMDAIQMLHLWFGFMRGTWAGPLFPQGVSGDSVVWRLIAPWKLREDRKVASWLPEKTPLDMNAAFDGFTRLWKDPAWREPLINAIGWLTEANSSRIVREVSIVLAQVALELLSWVWVVERCRMHSRRDFRALSAAGRMRALLQQVGVPAAVPDYFTDLPALCKSEEAFDGPGVITEIRNALVHATEHKRAGLREVSSVQLYECSQLAIQYVELTLLSICGYRGRYSRRGWRHGWKGQDEVVVPWA